VGETLKILHEIDYLA